MPPTLDMLSFGILLAWYRYRITLLQKNSLYARSLYRFHRCEVSRSPECINNEKCFQTAENEVRACTSLNKPNCIPDELTAPAHEMHR